MAANTAISDENIWNLLADFQSAVNVSDEDLEKEKPQNAKDKDAVYSKSFEHCTADESKNEIAAQDKERMSCINSGCLDSKVVLIESNYTCLACGTIQERYIDNCPEWRFYGSEDSKSSDPSRCGMPTNSLYPTSGLGSMIGYEKGNSFMYKIRRYQIWNSMPYRERSLYNIMDSLAIVASNNGIPPKIIEEAKSMYKTLSERKLSRGENRVSLLASSIYMSCKTNKVPRSAKEIAKMYNINTTAMTRGCKMFHETMKTKMLSSVPEDFVDRFCSKLGCMSIRNECIATLKVIEEYSIVSENAPPSIAAACVFLIAGKNNLGITKKKISHHCEISEVTITKCFKKLDMYKDFINAKVAEDNSNTAS